MHLTIVRDINALQATVATWREEKLSTAIVPTMGALHEGHLTLVAEAFARADRVVVTIFVNPRQFGLTEDLSRYPRQEEADTQLLGQHGVNLLFAPALAEIYPPHFATIVRVEGPAKAGLEDKFRPHFFDGVATIVAKLLIAAGTDFAVFGEKDYQQLQVVKRMTEDLGLPTRIIGVPTHRDSEGLALSSRNQYLSRAERHQAAAIHKNLRQAAEKIRAGAKPQLATRAASRSLTTLGFKVDYVTARNAHTLAVPTAQDEPLRLLAAAWLGKTRLIDNIAV